VQRLNLVIIGCLASCQAGGGLGFNHGATARTGTATSTGTGTSGGEPASNGSSDMTSTPALPGPENDNTLVTMPAVYKLSRADAEAAIRRAGVRGKINVIMNDGPASTEVCHQVPSQGGKTTAHFSVDIEMCRPEEAPAKELDVTGLTVAAATAKAKAFGTEGKFGGKIEVRVTPTFVPGCKEDTVCSTDINQDGILLLYLNRKRAAISTPD
jgi:hypothetical protein